MHCPIADARLQHCVGERWRRHRRFGGFTLIELVAAIVILGAIAAVAVPVLRDLRFDARRTSILSIRATLIANMNAARAAYLARGRSAFGTVRVNGMDIEVYGEGLTDSVSGALLPPGAPTGAAMFVMMGCGADPPNEQIEVPCESLPGYTAWVRDAWLQLTAAGSYDDSSCWVAYFSPYGYDPRFALNTSNYEETIQGTEISIVPASLVPNGC
jgi:prepilin-type N-terminal cleavage/methylation domain-containing protein